MWYGVATQRSQNKTKDDLQMITIANWKSTRFKRKNREHTVSRVSRHGPWSRIRALASLLTFRSSWSSAEQNSSHWETQLAAVPYIAVTDSRTLYDCMNKLVCSYTQSEDKRTAIDIAILKDDLKRSGGHAGWVADNNMVANALTERMTGIFLRVVCNKRKRTLTHHGNQLLRFDFELLMAFAIA